MADAKASYSVSLEDDVSKTANSAADALERMKKQINEEIAALSQMKTAMGRLKGSTPEVIAEKKKLEKQIKATEESLARNQAAYLKAGGSLKDLSAKTQQATASTGGFGTALKGVPGPAGGAASKISGLSSIMSSSGGMAALAAGGIALLVAAVVALAVAGVGAAFVMADMARTNKIYLSAVAGSAEGGAELAESIKRVRNQVPLAQSEVQTLAVALSNLGLKGGTLERGLRAVGTATGVLGQQAGGALQSIIQRATETKRFSITVAGAVNELKGTGITIQDVASALAENSGKSVAQAMAALKAGSVDAAAGVAALDKAVQNKLGGAAKEQMKGFAQQAQRAKDLLGRLFEGLKINKLLDGLEKIIDLLDESSAIGNAIKTTMEVMMNPLSDWIGGNGVVVKRFFQGVTIAALYVALGVLKIRNAFNNAFGKDALKDLDLAGAALVLGAVAATVFAVGLLIAGAAIAAIVLSVAGLAKAVKSAYNAIKKLDWEGVGQAVVDGLSAKLDSIPDLFKDAGKEAVKSFLDAIEAKSPARAFIRAGRYIVQGLEQGYEDEEPSAQRALSNVVSIPALENPRATGEAAAKGASGRAPVSLTFNATFNIQGSSDRDLLPKIKQAVNQVVLDALIQAGLDPVTT